MHFQIGALPTLDDRPRVDGSRFHAHLVIKYASSPCGSGKTHEIVNRAYQLANDHHHVLVLQPTKELIEKTVAAELLSKKHVPAYRIFHGETVGGSVAGELTRYFNNPQDAAQIVFATHQVFPHILYIANKRDWHLIIDEEMQVLRYASHRLPKTHDLITDDIELAPYNSIYSRVILRNAASLKAKARNKEDDELLAHLAETIRTLTNPYWTTYVNTGQYDRLLRGEIKTLAFHSILKPDLIEGFGSVFMAAANFEDTALYQLWSQNHEFQANREFAKPLRFNQHQNGSLITIYYADEAQWSRKRAESSVNSDQSRNVKDLLTDAVQKLFGSEQFLWQANKSFDRNPFGPNALRLPNKPHGLNLYADIHDIAFLSHLNPTTDHFRFLGTQGLSGNDVYRAIYYATAYQSVMRTSIRDPENQHPKRILVPDIGLAQYLNHLFPESRIERLDAGIPEIVTNATGRPRKHQSNRERVAAQRRSAINKKIDLLNQLFALQQNRQDTLRENWDNGKVASRCAESSIDSISGFGTSAHDLFYPFVPTFINHQCSGTVYPDKFAARPLCYFRWFDEKTSIGILKSFHQREITAKECNYLISPAVFDPELSAGKCRGMENILYVRNVWLDFEEGELKPDEFPPLFPDLRMLILNTYHHTAEKPRFRVIIPTTQSVTPDVYKQLYGDIAAKLEDAGYFVRRPGQRQKGSQLLSGLDLSKASPTSLFYLPCRAEEPKESFFKYHNDAGRTALDPVLWVENAPIPLQPEYECWSGEEPKNGPVDQSRVDRAIAEWRSTPKGYGNEGFFKLAVECKQAGMNANQIEELLEREAKFGRSPVERRNQIASIMESLSKGPGGA